jgi:hypothetical protein
MFFRFDPGFRAELEAARVSWRREPTPISIDALSDKARFKLRVRLGNDRTLLEVARRLAARWGLHPEAMARTVAYDAPVNYPTVVVRSWETDPISGLRCLELRVFSEHAWAPLRRAIEAEEWLQDLQDLAWFRDTPARPYSRLRGMDAKVAARTLAIYFLTSPAPGARPTGGNRSWDDAVSLWNELPDEKPTGPELDEKPTGPELDEKPTGPELDEKATGPELDERTWRRQRKRLLGLVYSPMPSAVTQLRAIKDERDVPRDEWLALLGIDSETWDRIFAEQPVSRAAWKSICAALPEAADDLMAKVRHEGLITRAR